MRSSRLDLHLNGDDESYAGSELASNSRRWKQKWLISIYFRSACQLFSRLTTSILVYVNFIGLVCMLIFFSVGPLFSSSPQGRSSTTRSYSSHDSRYQYGSTIYDRCNNSHVAISKCKLENGDLMNLKQCAGYTLPLPFQKELNDLAESLNATKLDAESYKQRLNLTERLLSSQNSSLIAVSFEHSLLLNTTNQIISTAVAEVTECNRKLGTVDTELSEMKAGVASRAEEYAQTINDYDFKIVGYESQLNMMEEQLAKADLVRIENKYCHQELYNVTYQINETRSYLDDCKADSNLLSSKISTLISLHAVELEHCQGKLSTNQMQLEQAINKSSLLEGIYSARLNDSMKNTLHYVHLSSTLNSSIQQLSSKLETLQNLRVIHESELRYHRMEAALIKKRMNDASLNYEVKVASFESRLDGLNAQCRSCLDNSNRLQISSGAIRSDLDALSVKLKSTEVALAQTTSELSKANKKIEFLKLSQTSNPTETISFSQEDFIIGIIEESLRKQFDKEDIEMAALKQGYALLERELSTAKSSLEQSSSKVNSLTQALLASTNSKRVNEKCEKDRAELIDKMATLNQSDFMNSQALQRAEEFLMETKIALDQCFLQTQCNIDMTLSHDQCQLQLQKEIADAKSKACLDTVGGDINDAMWDDHTTTNSSSKESFSSYTTACFNIAHLNQGVEVVYSQTSRTYTPFAISLSSTTASLPSTSLDYLKAHALKVLGIDFSEGRPEDALTDDLSPGSCWPFKGTSGVLTLKLPRPLQIEGVAIEHATRDTVQDQRSAPKAFKVRGSLNLDGPNRLLFNGEFSTQLPNRQTFSYADESTRLIEHREENRIQFITLEILSNHGNDEYTCLYGFRVFGT